MSTHQNKFSIPVLALLLAVAGTGCAVDAESPSDDTSPNADARDGDDGEIGETTSELRISPGLGAEGDACTVRTNPDGTTVPGTEKGLECCSTANPTDCVVILKPFPKFTLRHR